jgi:hypothetical protein
LLAHLVGWDYANIESVKEIRSGNKPGVFDYWNPNWSSFNARLVREHKRDNWNEMLMTLEMSHEKLIKTLKRIPAKDFEKDFGVRSPRGRNITIGEHLEAEIDDEKEHYAQMQQWLKRE